jgi:RimJ/RimL family protein N-acetyltransferase
MVPFASTEGLNFREQRESDTERLMRMVNDPRVQRGFVDYVRPKGENKRKQLASLTENALIVVIAEAKVPLEGETSTEDNLFAGVVTLSMLESSKNRDATLGISLLPKWWGRGLGTQAVGWIVGHAFEELGMHRVSLYVLADNQAAIALYRKV